MASQAPTLPLTLQHHRRTMRESRPNPGGSKEFLTAAKRRRRKNYGHSSDPPEGWSSVRLDDPERDW